MTSVAFVNSRGWGQEELVSCWADSKQFDIIGVCKHRRMVAPRLEGYWWMGGGAAPGRSGYGRGGAVYLRPGGTVDDLKVTLAAIEKRILDVVKEGRPLIIGGDWNARVGKGWNGRGELTYNTRGKVLVESFKRLALSLPQLEVEMPVFTWRAGKRKSIVDYVVAWRWTCKVVGDGWQAWTDHRPLVVELKDSADNCGRVWMER
ncbi:hypothetical protein QOT17_023598 [Balamuthia mandrillaris]